MSKHMWAWPDRRSTIPPTSQGERRNSSRRLRLRLEIAVPVMIRGENGLQRGLARNISEGGMLIEVTETPPIGSRVEVTISGVKNSSDSPESLVLAGEVRHHVAWQYTQVKDKQVMRGIGVRFTDDQADLEDQSPVASWVFETGHTVH